MNNNNKITTNRNYSIRIDCDGNAELISCPPPAGYSTVARAKEAEINEIKEEIRFHLEIISGLLNDIKEANGQQARAHLYRKINGLLDEIEKAKKRESKVRQLEL